MSGNAKDVCMEEAKGKEKVAKAEADAAYKNTPKARESARVAHADADYNVAKEKCDDLAGNQKDVCVKEAKAAHMKAKADAKVDRVAADTSNTAAEKTAEARKRCGGRQARRRLQGRDREVRFAVRRGQGRVRQEREGEVRQELDSLAGPAPVGSPPIGARAGATAPALFFA